MQIRHSTTGLFMSITVRFILATALVAAFVTGCSTVKDGAQSTYEFVFDDHTTTQPIFPEKDSPLEETTFDMADAMSWNVNRDLLPKDSPIFVSAFVNMENPNDMSSFGTVIANQLAVRLFQKGWRIAEGAPPDNAVAHYDAIAEKHTDNDLVRDKEYSLQPAILAGAYQVGEDSILVTAKVVRMRDNLITAAHAWTLPMTQRIRSLLNMPGSARSTEPTVRTTLQ